MTKQMYIGLPNAIKRRAHSLMRKVAHQVIGTSAFGVEEFYAACRKFGVTEIVAQGDYGAMQGRIDDRYIMASYLSRGDWDADKVSFVRSLLKDGGTFIDVGANIGMYTVPIAAANEQVRCVAIEPEPRNFRLLSNNVEVNGLVGRVDLHNVAITEVGGPVTMSLSPRNFGDHRIKFDQGVNVEISRQDIRVESCKFDELISQKVIRGPIVAKIDVQGAELSVVRSAQATLPKVDYLILEFWPHGLLAAGHSPETLLEILGKHFALGASFGKREKIGRNPNMRPFADIVRLVSQSDWSSANLSFDLLLATSTSSPRRVVDQVQAG